MARQVPFNELALGYGSFIRDESGKYQLLSPQAVLYLNSLGRPPQNKFSDTEWPQGPVKAKRAAIKMVDEG